MGLVRHLPIEEFRVDRRAWKPFLERWSEEWHIAQPDSELWLGFPAASEAQVTALEERLGRVLPPSFREFLLVTNGWRDAGHFVWQLRGTDEIGWMRDLDPLTAELPGDAEGVLERSLLISLEADAGVVFLDPGDVDEHGEWAAYDLFSWTGSGPERYDSFYEKMYDFYAGFHALDRPLCETQREWDAKVEQARLASLTGEVDGPLTVLGQASGFGRDRAHILKFQLLAMLGQAGTGDRFTYLLGRGHILSSPLDEALFTAEILPLLFAEHERAHGDGSTVAILMELGSDEVKRLIAEYRARADKPGFELTFGNPEFDAAVRVALKAGDEAWPLLRDALALWRPMSGDHLVPLSLLADPRTARLVTPERGHEILTTRRG
jgi:hypothetical protein